MVLNPSEVALLPHIGAVRVLCLKGLVSCPPDALGGYSVSWMRRQLLGRIDHSRILDRRLEKLMSLKGFARRCDESCVFTLQEKENDEFFF